MIFQLAHLADNPGAGNIRDRIKALTDQVRAQPNNQAALLQLANLYGQVWASTRQKEISARIAPCLQRAISLETGRNAAQIRQFLAAMAKHAQTFGDQEFLEKLKGLHAQLNAKTAAPQPAPPAPAPAPSPAPSAPPAPSALAEQSVPPAPKTKREKPETRPAAAESVLPEHLPPGPLDMEVNVETVEDPSAREAAPRAPAVLPGQGSQDIRKMFDEGNVGLIIQTYASMPGPHARKQIVEGLVQHLNSWKIEPVLAIAALETDEQIFRYAMRLLLKSDRNMICEQIQLEKYSPDLQKVAVTVLGELGTRTALPKLEKALDMEDPLVRCVAVNGVARFGKGAVKHIPVLIRTVKSDPNGAVRLAAAKALNTMNVPEAYEALEKEAVETKFDGKILEALNAMREKFGGASGAGDKTTAEKKPASGGKAASPQKGGNKILILVFVVAAVLAAAYYAWMKLKGP